ncbi:FecR family protein [Sphingobacterium spiritivorum]|uniref:FecR family protein n=1 Tax=Sphingobacterium spiritivorum TaxID=258 RepID=UPI003DA4E863
MRIEQVKDILTRYNNGKASTEEKAKLDNWYANESFKQMQNSGKEDYERIKKELFASLAAYPNNKVKVKSFWRVVWIRSIAATVVILLLGIWIYIAGSKYYSTANSVVADLNINPGIVGATLYLANGKKIKLTETAEGEIIKDAGMIITKSVNGELIYENENRGKIDYNKMNTLHTGRGQTFKVVLPDGSKVWLNTASSLTYSAGLIQGGKRSVKLQGEAYFEISKDKKFPFVVESDDQRVTVLGTHFNIESYADQGITKTTLLEGAVKISDAVSNFSRTVLLKPGQQAVLVKGNISVKNTDANMAIAWKNGEFVFSEEKLSDIMTKLSRWYNVEIVYLTGAPLHLRFNANLSRSNNLSETLNIIQTTGKVKFKIENRKVFVSGMHSI